MDERTGNSSIESEVNKMMLMDVIKVLDDTMPFWIQGGTESNGVVIRCENKNEMELDNMYFKSEVLYLTQDASGELTIEINM